MIAHSPHVRGHHSRARSLLTPTLESRRRPALRRVFDGDDLEVSSVARLDGHRHASSRRIDRRVVSVPEQKGSLATRSRRDRLVRRGRERAKHARVSRRQLERVRSREKLSSVRNAPKRLRESSTTSDRPRVLLLDVRESNRGTSQIDVPGPRSRRAFDSSGVSRVRHFHVARSDFFYITTLAAAKECIISRGGK